MYKKILTEMTSTYTSGLPLNKATAYMKHTRKCNYRKASHKFCKIPLTDYSLSIPNQKTNKTNKK